MDDWGAGVDRRRWSRPLALVFLVASCGHRAAQPSTQDSPRGDVVASLRPCPPGLQARTVSEVAGKFWPGRACLAVTGRLQAVVTELDHDCLRPLRSSAPGHEQPSSGKCQMPKWILVDANAPAVPVHVAGEDGEVTSYLEIDSLDYRPALRPIERCNRRANGETIMPADSHTKLARFSAEAAPAIAASLSSTPVVAFGTMAFYAEDLEDPIDVPDQMEMGTHLFIGYICRRQ